MAGVEWSLYSPYGPLRNTKTQWQHGTTLILNLEIECNNIVVLAAENDEL